MATTIATLPQRKMEEIDGTIQATKFNIRSLFELEIILQQVGNISNLFAQDPEHHAIAETQADINDLPVEIKEHMQELCNCKICFSLPVLGGRVYSCSQCGTHLCQACRNRLLENTRRLSCPYCRKSNIDARNITVERMLSSYFRKAFIHCPNDECMASGELDAMTYHFQICPKRQFRCAKQFNYMICRTTTGIGQYLEHTGFDGKPCSVAIAHPDLIKNLPLDLTKNEVEFKINIFDVSNWESIMAWERSANLVPIALLSKATIMGGLPMLFIKRSPNGKWKISIQLQASEIITKFWLAEICISNFDDPQAPMYSSTMRPACSTSFEKDADAKNLAMKITDKDILPLKESFYKKNILDHLFQIKIKFIFHEKFYQHIQHMAKMDVQTLNEVRIEETIPTTRRNAYDAQWQNL